MGNICLFDDNLQKVKQFYNNSLDILDRNHTTLFSEPYIVGMWKWQLNSEQKQMYRATWGTHGEDSDVIPKNILILDERKSDELQDIV
jgi:hypothetical protein